MRWLSPSFEILPEGQNAAMTDIHRIQLTSAESAVQNSLVWANKYPLGMLKVLNRRWHTDERAGRAQGKTCADHSWTHQLGTTKAVPKSSRVKVPVTRALSFFFSRFSDSSSFSLSLPSLISFLILRSSARSYLISLLKSAISFVYGGDATAAAGRVTRSRHIV